MDLYPRGQVEALVHMLAGLVAHAITAISP